MTGLNALPLTGESAKGTAQQATRDQDDALAAMNDWLAQYIKITKKGSSNSCSKEGKLKHLVICKYTAIVSFPNVLIGNLDIDR